VAQALLSFFLQHGFYVVVKSDNGTEFINSLQAELEKLTQIRSLTSCAYDLRQTPVERSHRTINAMFAKNVDRHSDWAQYVNYIAFAYNSTVQISRLNSFIMVVS
jgi:hypothetical protein